MLEQTATVTAVQDGRLVLEVIPQSTCGSCAVKSGCGTSVLASSVGQKVVRFELDNTLDASAGERVVIGVPENAVVGGSLLMYLVPLLVMFAFAMISDQLLPLTDASRDIKIAVMALIGLGLSVVLGRRLMVGNSASYQPVLLRKEISVTSVDGARPVEPG